MNAASMTTAVLNHMYTKLNNVDISKHIKVQKRALSVTDVTLKAGESPSRRYERLKPWLEFANLLPKPEKTSIPGTPGVTSFAFPPEPSDELLRRGEATGVLGALELLPLPPIQKEEAQAQIQKLAFQVARTLDYLAETAEHFDYFEKSTSRQPGFHGFCVEPLDTGIGSVEIREGILVASVRNPFESFLEALDGAEAGRVRRCPVCGHIFYALRTSQKACSKRCNQTRRVRDWRKGQSQYEQNRKFKLAGVRPEGKKR